MLLTMTTPEEAVRRYLVSLTDPESLLDSDAIAEAEKMYEDSEDPIEKVRAHAALKKARTGDQAGARLGFINNARKWAQEEQIPFDAFRQLGVPHDVLEAAGLVDAKGKKKGGSNLKVRKRAAKVSISDISEWMLQQDKPFTTSDIASSIGGSPATIKKAIDELTARKQIRNLGVDNDHTARGRAPFVYTTVKEAANRTSTAAENSGAGKPVRTVVKDSKGSAKPRTRSPEKELVSA
jgi:hypothetical protein